MPKTKAMQFWQPSIQPARGPIYLAIADAIGLAIRNGELSAGQRMPPQRSLAAHLGVDLTTVTRAYAEAEQRGLIQGSVGRGTFVRADGPAPRPENPAPSGVDMSMNMPPQPPLLRLLLQDGMAALLRGTDMPDLMAYRSGLGTRLDRAMAASWLRPVMHEVDPDRILVCGGVPCALTGLLTTLARPGDTILTEALTYPSIRALAAQLGIRLVGVATDAAGLLPDELERACREVQPKAIYCVPTIQNPTTVTTSPERRQAVAAIALRTGVSIIEDDAYGLLPRTPLAAIATMAPSVSYYLSTLSKCLSPGLRTAYVVAPDRLRASRLGDAIRATSLTPPPLMTSVLTEWIRSGAAITLRDAVRDEAAARQLLALEMLPGACMAAHPDGLHVWLTLPAHWNRVEFSVHVRRVGLTLVPSDVFRVEGVAQSARVDAVAQNAVRICLGVADTRAVLRGALQSVADAMQADAPSQFAGIV
jgi:DNA-binding transcriptional MocR family regulator